MDARKHRIMLALLVVAGAALWWRSRAVAAATVDWQPIAWPDLELPRIELPNLDAFWTPIVAATAQLGEAIGDAGGVVLDVTAATDQAQAGDADANVRAFLAMIRHAEGTAGPDGYRTLFGGGLFDSYADHPRTVVRAKLGATWISSAAAGAYQIMPATWDTVIQPRANLPDFSPASQDAAALVLLRYRGALDDVRAGRFAAAVDKVRREWASLPGAGYGQPERRFADLQAVYLAAGGALA